jgi:DNA polymerase III epsilon subunit-like protein
LNNPNNSESYWEVVNILHDQGKNKEAFDYFSKIVNPKISEMDVCHRVPKMIGMLLSVDQIKMANDILVGALSKLSLEGTETQLDSFISFLKTEAKCLPLKKREEILRWTDAALPPTAFARNFTYGDVLALLSEKPTIHPSDVLNFTVPIQDNICSLAENTPLEAVNHKDVKPNDFPQTYVIYDLETTGLDPMNDEAIEIGALLVREGEDPILKTWLLRSSIFITPEITRITGITQDNIDRFGRDPVECWKEFAKFTGIDTSVSAYHLIGHNIIGFDNAFTQRALEKIGLSLINVRCIDTAAIFKGGKMNELRKPGESHKAYAKRILGTKVPGLKYNLQLAYTELGGSMDDIKAHRVEGDVRMTDFVYKSLINLPTATDTQPIHPQDFTKNMDRLETLRVQLPGNTIIKFCRPDLRKGITVSIEGRNGAEDRITGVDVSVENCKALLEFFCIPR